jgi:hypothetical protein
MIVFPKPGKKKGSLEAFTTRMLGLPRFNGSFDFSRPELKIPSPFPLRAPETRITKRRMVGFLERLDNGNMILSKNKTKFSIAGASRLEFSLPSPCKELVVRNGEAYLLTDKLLCIYKDGLFRMYLVEAVCLCSSPFNEMILLLRDRILIFNSAGLVGEHPFKGEVKHIQCYLAREVVVADDHNVYHVDLLSGAVRLICTVSNAIVKLVLLDRLYILESRRITLVNIEDGTTQSLHIEPYMSLEIGEDLLAAYLLSGEFYFCDRHDLSNNCATIFDAPGLLGFKFIGSDAHFYFDDRVVMWSSSGTSTSLFGIEEEDSECRLELPDNPKVLEGEYNRREREHAEYKSSGVFEMVKEMADSLLHAPTDRGPSKEAKKMKYIQQRKGGF